jgi:hypothetical protein
MESKLLFMEDASVRLVEVDTSSAHPPATYDSVGVILAAKADLLAAQRAHQLLWPKNSSSVHCSSFLNLVCYAATAAIFNLINIQASPI